MPKQTSVNLDITSNPDGFDISGGSISRKLALTGGNATFVGRGGTYVLPTGSGRLLSESEAVTSFNGQTGAVQNFYSLTGATSNTYPQGVSGAGFTGDRLLIATGAPEDPFRNYVRYGNHWFQTGVIGLPDGTFTSPVTAPGYRYSASAFETKTAGFTFGDSTDDNGKVFVMNNTTRAGVIIKQGNPIGFSAEFIVGLGAGAVDFSAQPGVTLNGAITAEFTQPLRIQLMSYATDTYMLSHGANYLF